MKYQDFYLGRTERPQPDGLWQRHCLNNAWELYFEVNINYKKICLGAVSLKGV
jgi:hypothetical protein